VKLTAELMNEIDQNIHKIDRLKADINQYELDIKEHNDQKPQPPKVVLDYEEYNQYLDDLQWWQTTLEELINHLKLFLGYEDDTPREK